MTVLEIFEKIKNTAGANAKRAILDSNKTGLLELIFTDTYDKSRNYYVKKYTVTGCGACTIEQNYELFHNMLNNLNTRAITGNAAIEFVENTLSLYTKEDQDILCKILDRNLKIGIGMESFNKVSESTIDKFEVALAYNLDKVKNVNPIDGTFFASRKLDGVRCIAIVNPMVKTVRFLSRQGKEFTTLKRLEYPLLKMTESYNEVMVFDGELCFVDENGNENFSKAVQNVTKKDVVAEDVRYCIFDFMSFDVFNYDGGKIFSERYNEYQKLHMKYCVDIDVATYITPLIQERITTQEQFDKWTSLVKDNGWEGFMLRKDTQYKSGRVKDLIKVKKFQDAEYIVEGIETGTAVYNEDGMKEYDIVSAIVISHKGNKVNVGSGLSKEQRIAWYNDPTQIIGKTVTVQYFEESTNKNNDGISLRFPVLKFVYEAARDI